VHYKCVPGILCPRNFYTVSTVGGVATGLLRNGQVLNLATAGLTEVSHTANAAGQTVRQVTDRGGQALR
jgi:hypothetical protein